MGLLLAYVLSHPTYCQNGAEFDVKPGEHLLACLLQQGIDVPHACEMQGVCGDCHVYVREGAKGLEDPSDHENDTLGAVWGGDIDSRLSCQTIVGDSDLIIETPKYTANISSEKL